ncbi:protein-L-isoaspartate O-methyltransferase [Candidatus Parcubacteria bacterium]|nr:protein-L-isoaspartate O-methyltransferase [Candidatus Parcubacteria bacterium]
MDLVQELIKDGWLKTPEIIEAFQKIKREDFLPPEIKHLAQLNEALPIGFGQTISQPLVVAFLLELLQPKRGEKILDIGSGSGWTTALLSFLVGETGRVIGIEILPELFEFGKKNVQKYNFLEKGIAKMILGDGTKGFEKEAPFDKILVSAEAKKLYCAWKEQLKIKGRIVVPIGNSIWLFEKQSETEFSSKEYPGFVFVPLVEK